MTETPFIITIDTEGDNLWARPREITTRNAAFLPRFQSLCERFGFKPVYLTNYEMAQSAEFVEFARDVLARDAGEIGMHLHAWNSPPLAPLTGDDYLHHPYLIEYRDSVMREKIKTLTGLLELRFKRKMLSHRAGRWAFDTRYAQMLVDEGYRVDCSVTPGIDWGGNPGDPDGNGGTDYAGFPAHPYFFDPADISRPSRGPLLEVPVSIRPSAMNRMMPWTYRVPLLRSAAYRLSPPNAWLSPAESGIDAMLGLVSDARQHGVDHLEFMLHSSEFMPGGSPRFRTDADIERLYEVLETLFEHVSRWCRGMTLNEFHELARSQ